MRIKLDENLSRHLVPLLAELGHDASTAAEEGLLGESDVKIGTVARSEGRMVFSLDMDFADLRQFPPGQHPGVIVFRPRRLSPIAVNSFIALFVASNSLTAFERCVVVVEPGRIRIRRAPADEDKA